MANTITNKYLGDYRAKIDAEGPEVFLNQYDSIRAEYAGNRPVKVVPADMEFSDEVRLDAGNCVRIGRPASSGDVPRGNSRGRRAFYV